MKLEIKKNNHRLNKKNINLSLFWIEEKEKRNKICVSIPFPTERERDFICRIRGTLLAEIELENLNCIKKK
jgi:translation initiation factor 1 (eIF-1/SUI1)